MTHVAPVLTGITATFTQGGATIYDTDDLNDLKQYLTVVASYSDGTTAAVSSSDYTLSGSLVAPSSTITVTYEGFTDTFTVQVTHQQVLPYDSKVEYLASDGNAYIDTGITVNQGAVKFLIDMNIPSNSLSGNQVVHGIGTIAPNWFGQANGKYGAGGTANSSIDIGQRVLVLIDFSNNRLDLTIDSNYIGYRTGSIVKTISYKLFKNGNYTVPSMVYSFKALDASDNVLMHLIPVRKNGEGYLHDEVSGTMFGNNGTSNFTYGNDV